MLKKLSVLLFLCALCMWAADFWTTKPFTEWNEKEVQKMLSSSPWSETVTVSAGAGGGPGGPPPATGGGGGRGRSGPQGDSTTADPGIGGGDFGGGGGGGGVTVTLLWQTAMPIRQALVKRQYGTEAGTSPEAKAKLDRVDQVYVLTLIGMPGSMLGATQADKKAALLDATMVTAGGKPPIKAIDVQTTGGRGPTANVSFLFPKTMPFTVEDKEMEFSTRFDKTTIKKKFKLKDMVFNGKVEM
jgi:hypothetical protein